MITLKRIAISASLLASAVILIQWFPSLLLRQLGHLLVSGAERSPVLSAAEVVLVPNADHLRTDMARGRLEQAALLVRKGLAGSVLMTCGDYYGVSVCDLASDALKRWGYPEILIRRIRTNGIPDSLEARLILSRCEQAGIRTAFVLLPNYKIHRLSAVYAELAREYGLKIAVLESSSGDFDPDSWWSSRDSQRLFFEEAVRWTRLF